MTSPKKILKDTVGIAVGSVGISEANKITPFGDVIGTSIGAGLVTTVTKKKKGGF